MLLSLEVKHGVAPLSWCGLSTLWQLLMHRLETEKLLRMIVTAGQLQESIDGGIRQRASLLQLASDVGNRLGIEVPQDLANQRMDTASIDALRKLVPQWREILETVGLPLALKQLDALADLLDRDPFPVTDLHLLVRDFREFRRRVQDELELVSILWLPPERARYYDRDIFGSTIAAAFPSASFDLEEGARCFAVGRFTACVFHLMRAQEVTLGALSAHLRIVKHSPTWEAYLSAMPSAIQAAYPNKDKAHGDKRTYFSGLEGQLRSIKTAWRNPTMHQIAKTYTEEMAEELVVLVRGFMREAATELKE